MCYEKGETDRYVPWNVARLVYWHSREQFLKLNKVIIQHPPFWDYNTWQFNSTNDWGCIWWCVTITRSVDSLGSILPGFPWIQHLGAMWAWPDLCGCTGVAWDVAGIGARAFFRTAGMAGNSWSLVHLGCQCYGCSGCGLHVRCRWGWCRLCCWEAVSCWSL